MLYVLERKGPVKLASVQNRNEKRPWLSHQTVVIIWETAKSRSWVRIKEQKKFKNYPVVGWLWRPSVGLGTTRRTCLCTITLSKFGTATSFYFSPDSSNFSVLSNNIFSYLVNTWMPCLCTITNDEKTSFFNQFSVTSRRIRRTPPHKNFSFLLHKEARELKCNNASSIEFILTHVETTFWVGMWNVIPLFSCWRICHVKCEWKSSISCKDMFLP